MSSLVESLNQVGVCVYVCICVTKYMICTPLVFCRAKIYAVEGLKVVFSQTLAICSAKQ